MIDNEFQYRYAAPADYEQIQVIINAAYEVEKFFKTTDRIDMEEIISKSETGKFLLAQNKQGITACIYLEFMGEKAYFGLLSVHPNSQGQGLARKLIAKAEELSVKEACAFMEIEVVNLRNELFPFYTKMGYHESGVRPFKDVAKSRLPCHFVVMSKMLA